MHYCARSIGVPIEHPSHSQNAFQQPICQHKLRTSTHSNWGSRWTRVGKIQCVVNPPNR